MTQRDGWRWLTMADDGSCWEISGVALGPDPQAPSLSSVVMLITVTIALFCSIIRYVAARLRVTCGLWNWTQPLFQRLPHACLAEFLSTMTKTRHNASSQPCPLRRWNVQYNPCRLACWLGHTRSLGCLTFLETCRVQLTVRLTCESPYPCRS